MERILHMSILNNFGSRSKLSGAPHSFAKPRYFWNNFLVTEKKVVQSLTEVDGVDLVFVDLARSFDSGKPSLLPFKLQVYGRHANVIGWIRDFMSNLNFVVWANYIWSLPSDACSEFLQVSMIGLILLLDNFPNILCGKVIIFANNVKIMISARSNLVELNKSIM